MIVQCHDSPVSFCLEGVSGVLYAHVPFGVLCRMVHRVTWTPQTNQLTSAPNRQDTYGSYGFTGVKNSQWPINIPFLPQLYMKVESDVKTVQIHIQSGIHGIHMVAWGRVNTIECTHYIHPLTTLVNIPPFLMIGCTTSLTNCPFLNIRKTSTTAKFWFVKPYKLCLYVYICLRFPSKLSLFSTKGFLPCDSMQWFGLPVCQGQCRLHEWNPFQRRQKTVLLWNVGTDLFFLWNKRPEI